MRVLVTGAGGQLGQALCATAPAEIELHAFSRNRLDLRQYRNVEKTVQKVRPDWIVNAAACTAVDRIELEPEPAFAVNERGAANLALAAAETDSRLLQLSTDFVFDGRQGRPYRPDDTPAPVCVYGESKLGGERAVMEVLGSDAVILRTAWLYSSGEGNFVTTMLRLMVERDRVRVVCDQVGTPTWVGTLAPAIWRMLFAGHMTGIQHWTDAGVASWYDLAFAIREEALDRGLLRTGGTLQPVSSAEYPTAARRPSFSVLDKSDTWSELGEVSPHWRVSLRRLLDEIAVRQAGAMRDARTARKVRA